MGKHDIAVNKIASKEVGVDVAFDDISRYSEYKSLIDFTDDSQIPNIRAVKELVGNNQVIPIFLDTDEPSLYTLSPSQLSAVNELGRQPNFSAVTSSGSGFSDIQPIYTPAFGGGSYTEIKVTLHDDGSGNNAEDTLVQFS